MNSKSNSSDKFIRLLPYLLFLIAFSGIALAIYLRQVNLAIMGSVLIVPVLVAAIIILLRNNRGFDLRSLAFKSRLRFSDLVLIYIFLFVISLILLFGFAERPLAYFIVISLISGVLVLQILATRTKLTDYIIICEMIFLSLNMVWGLSLKYPLFFGSTDIMVHLNYIETVINTGHTAGISVDYRYFPAYHIFNAIGTEVTGIPVKNATFIIMGLAWQSVTVLAYLIFKRFSGSSKVALLASLIFVVDETEIYFGSYSIARSMAFVLFMAWLYLALNLWRKDTKYIPLLLIVMITMILTHHTTIVNLGLVLIVFYLCYKLFSGFRNRFSLLPSAPILLLEISFFSYLIWIASDLFAPLLPEFVTSLTQTETSIELNPRMMAGSPMSFIFNSVFFAFVLVFSLIGVKSAWNWGTASHRKPIFRTVALAALLFLIFYLPYPLGFIPQTQMTYSERFPLLVLPFIAFTMACGIYYVMEMEISLFQKLKRFRSWPFITIGLVSITTFFSLTAPGNAQDSSELPNSFDTGATYFTFSELDSFSFINQNGDTSLELYGDYFTVRNEFSFANIPLRQILASGDISFIKDGYLVLRFKELEKRGGLTFSSTGNINKIERFHIDPADPESDILTDLEYQDNIYSNDSVQIYLIRNNLDYRE